MKKKQYFIIVCLLLLCTVSVGAERIKIAILDLQAGVGCSQDKVAGLSEMLSKELFNSGYFIIVERSQVNRVLQANNLFGITTLTEAQLKLLGNNLRVDAVLIGTVNYIIRDVKLASDGVTKINSGEYNVDIRLMSTSNGTMISSAGDEGKGRSERELMKALALELVRNMESSLKKDSESVQTLYDYLSVYPKDIGSFSVYPSSVINVINRNNSYGFNDWRLPTEEELSIMEANASQLHLDMGRAYAHSSSWSRTSEKLQVRLVRTKIIVEQRSVNRQIPYFERTEHDFGQIPILSGIVKTRFCLQNPSPIDVSIENVTKTNSAITLMWDRGVISTGAKGFVTVYYNPNGRQGVSFNNSLKVQLSNGQVITLYVRGRVE